MSLRGLTWKIGRDGPTGSRRIYMFEMDLQGRNGPSGSNMIKWLIRKNLNKNNFQVRNYMKWYDRLLEWNSLIDVRYCYGWHVGVSEHPRGVFLYAHA